jgi:hypothetical protein
VVPVFLCLCIASCPRSPVKHHDVLRACCPSVFAGHVLGCQPWPGALVMLWTSCSQHYNVAVPLSAPDGSCMYSVPCSLQVLQLGICGHAFHPS